MITKLNPDAIDNASINMDKLANDVKELLDTNQKKLTELEQQTVENTTAINIEKSRAEKAEAALGKLFEAPHPKMTVGYAKNLIMPDTPTEQEFNFRQAGGGVIEDGVAVIDKVKGNSVVWNQLMKFNPSTVTIKGITYEVKSDGQIHIYGTANEQSTSVYYSQTGQIVEKHKYLIGGGRGTISGEANGVLPSIDGSYGIVSATRTSKSPTWFFRVSSGVTIDIKFRPMLLDLTQMFGAGNEPSSVEEFLSRKPKVADEYAYNEGEIINNKVEAVVTTGRNIWDEQWESGAYDGLGKKTASSNEIRSKNMYACLPHTQYYWSIPNKANGSYMGFCFFYDISGAFISKLPVGPNSYLTVTTPSNARFVAFYLRSEYGTTYTHDVCINLSDASFNGQYAPYEKHELDLSWIKEIKDENGVALFEDGMRSAGTAYDEAGAKKAVKRFAEIDLGNLDWSKGWWEDSGRLFVKLPGKARGFTNIISTIGETIANDSILKNKKGICGNGSNDYIYVGDAKSHTSADDFIQSLNGVKAIYELATPIEVEYDEKNLTYPVVAGGTEEAIASEPSTAFRADIGYGIDAVKTILDLRARVKALEGK